MPIMITALLSSGAIVSATSLEPVLLTVIEAALTLIKSIFMPLVMVGTGLGTINALSANLKTTRLVSLINNTVKYGLSVLLTVFVAFAGLQSIASSGADALTLKLTKFASSNLIPVVGGILSESVETVLNCSSVIKNSVGVVGVILVFFIAVMPIVNIIAAMLTFRLVAAFCEPIADKSLVECISCMANGISMVFSNASVGVSDVHNNYYCNDKYFNVEVLCCGLNQKLGIFGFGCSRVWNSGRGGYAKR